jgi:hypothetical protein
MSEFDPEIQALFENARAALEPPPGAEARAFAELAAKLAATACVVTSLNSTRAAKPALSLLSKLGKAISTLLPTAHALPIAAVALSGAAAGLWMHQRQEAPPRKAAVVSARSNERALPKLTLTTKDLAVVKLADASGVRKGTPVVVENTLEAAPVARLRRTATLSLSAVTSSAGAVASLPSVAPTPIKAAVEGPSTATSKGEEAALPDAEIALVARMHEAWRTGNMGAVAASVAEHERRFPRGILSEEREGMRAMLACQQHPERKAVIISGFVRSFPKSPYAERVERACGANLP